MNVIDVTDQQFLQALAAIDAGNTSNLEMLIGNHPRLLKDRIVNYEGGYFKDPYLLWFLAYNPIRANNPADNIIEITRALLAMVKREVSAEIYHHQINYTLHLVASGSVLRECNMQLKMIELLLAAGASPGGAMDALTQGNLEAARYLVGCGEKLTLTLAICLEREDDINALVANTGIAEKITALAAAAYYGKTGMVKYLLSMKTDPNGFPDANYGFHTHATALHQAVSSGSLACVQLLVEAGARLDVADKIYNGTPLEWAAYLHGENTEVDDKKNYFDIEAYLRPL